MNIYDDYEEMVARLFKSGELILMDVSHEYKNKPGTLHALLSLLHAAIGISTESGEILEHATNHPSFASGYQSTKVEELGDFLFYTVAAIQSLCTIYPELNMSYRDYIITDKTKPMPLPNYGEGAKLLVVQANNFLDIVAKKVLIYDTSIQDDAIRSRLFGSIFGIMAAFNSLAYYEGLTFMHIIRHNTKKLTGTGGRYENGEYSNSAAQARADKEPSTQAEEQK